jgi:hypothetical protein
MYVCRKLSFPINSYFLKRCQKVEKVPPQKSVHISKVLVGIFIEFLLYLIFMPDNTITSESLILTKLYAECKVPGSPLTQASV